MTGGKTYTNDSLRNVAKLPRGRKQVRFKFRKDGEFKQIVQDLNLVTKKDVWLSFGVELIPSQGYAKIKILPEAAKILDVGI